MENLESVIESVVFVAGEAVSVSDLCVKFDVKPKEVEKAVNNLKKKYDTVVERMEDYDFTEYNAYTVLQDLMKNITGSIEDTILDLFETLTAKYSWFSDGDKNIHYYNGWKSNKAWIINKKVIIPMNGAFSYDWFYKKYRVLQVAEALNSMKR